MTVWGRLKLKEREEVYTPGPQGYKTFFMFNSTDHKILVPIGYVTSLYVP